MWYFLYLNIKKKRFLISFGMTRVEYYITGNEKCATYFSHSKRQHHPFSDIENSHGTNQGKNLFFYCRRTQTPSFSYSFRLYFLTPPDISTCPHRYDPDIIEFCRIWEWNRRCSILEGDGFFLRWYPIEWCSIRSEESIETSDFVFFWEYLCTRFFPPSIGRITHPPLSDDLGCDRGWEDAARTMRAFLRILRVWSRVWSEEYFFIPWIYELLYRAEVFGVFQSRFTVEVWLEGRTSLFLMGGTEKVLGCDWSPKIRIFSWSHEFCHFSRRYVLDHDLELWMVHRDSLSERAKLSFSTMDESLRNMSITISRYGRLRVEWEYDTALGHSLEYFSRLRIIRIDVAGRSPWIRRDTSGIVFHRFNHASTDSDRLRSGLRSERDRHKGSRSWWQISYEFFSINFDFFTICYMIWW